MVSRVATMALGLLREGERHGYEIVRMMDERGMLRWTKASKVAVYKALARLEEEGCLTSWTERESNMPEKRVYAITAAGEERLKDNVYSLLASREPPRLDAAVGLCFMGCLDGEEAREALRARVAFLEGEEKRLRRERDMLEGLADHIYLGILSRELSSCRAEARWLRGIIGRIGEDGEEGNA